MTLLAHRKARQFANHCSRNPTQDIFACLQACSSGGSHGGGGKMKLQSDSVSLEETSQLHSPSTRGKHAPGAFHHMAPQEGKKTAGIRHHDREKIDPNTFQPRAYKLQTLKLSNQGHQEKLKTKSIGNERGNA